MGGVVSSLVLNVVAATGAQLNYMFHVTELDPLIAFVAGAAGVLETTCITMCGWDDQLEDSREVNILWLISNSVGPTSVLSTLGTMKAKDPYIKAGAGILSAAGWAYTFGGAWLTFVVGKNDTSTRTSRLAN